MIFLPKNEYEELHQKNITPLDIKIDKSLFLRDVEKYKFYQWGDTQTEFPRYACPLVNDDGEFKDYEPSCYPLDRLNFLLEYPEFKNKEWSPEHILAWKEWNSKSINMEEIINETHFVTPTEALSMEALEPLNPIKPYMYRTTIFKWHYLGHFKKHIDSWHPTPWIRLWGTLSPNDMILRIEEKEETNIEQGRIYLLDTLKWHEALAFRDNVYQFFICLNLDSIPIIKSLMI